MTSFSLRNRQPRPISKMRISSYKEPRIGRPTLTGIFNDLQSSPLRGTQCVCDHIPFIFRLTDIIAVVNNAPKPFTPEEQATIQVHRVWSDAFCCESVACAAQSYFRPEMMTGRRWMWRWRNDGNHGQVTLKKKSLWTRTTTRMSSLACVYVHVLVRIGLIFNFSSLNIGNAIAK